MSSCPLTPELLDALLRADLSPQQCQLLQEHLLSECQECGKMIEEAGLDLATLSMLLAEPTIPADDDSLQRVWSKIEPQIQVLPQNIKPRQPQPSLGKARPRLTLLSLFANMRWGFSAASLLAASLAIFYWAYFTSRTNNDLKHDANHDQEKPPTINLKGAPGPIEAELLLQLPPERGLTDIQNGDVINLSFSLAQPANISLLHIYRNNDVRSEDVSVNILYQSQTTQESGQELSFPKDGGRLAYRFEHESGEHAFVLLASESALPGLMQQKALALKLLKKLSNDKNSYSLRLASASQQRLEATIKRLYVEDHRSLP
jgi:hypothetical protein